MVKYPSGSLAAFRKPVTKKDEHPVHNPNVIVDKGGQRVKNQEPRNRRHPTWNHRENHLENLHQDKNEGTNQGTSMDKIF